MLFRGTLTQLCYPEGMTLFLSVARVLRKEFGAFGETPNPNGAATFPVPFLAQSRRGALGF